MQTQTFSRADAVTRANGLASLLPARLHIYKTGAVVAMVAVSFLMSERKSHMLSMCVHDIRACGGRIRVSFCYMVWSS